MSVTIIHQNELYRRILVMLRLKCLRFSGNPHCKRICFNILLLPSYLRHAKSIEELLP
ncbi:MAG: hypothetical protein ACTS73_01060 [Arsenophonus sp. NEOnobi-MAG3]